MIAVTASSSNVRYADPELTHRPRPGAPTQSAQSGHEPRWTPDCLFPLSARTATVLFRPYLVAPKAPITPPIIAPGTVPAIAPIGPAAIPNFAPAAAPVPAPAMSPTAVHFSSDVHIVQSSGLIRPPPCQTWNHPRRPPSEGQDGIEHAKSGTAREAACTPPYGADAPGAPPHTPASERRPNRSPSLTPPRARKHCSKGRTSGPRIRPEPP